MSLSESESEYVMSLKTKTNEELNTMYTEVSTSVFGKSTSNVEAHRLAFIMSEFNRRISDKVEEQEECRHQRHFKTMVNGDMANRCLDCEEIL